MVTFGLASSGSLTSLSLAADVVDVEDDANVSLLLIAFDNTTC
jgi:hypothetical protein